MSDAKITGGTEVAPAATHVREGNDAATVVPGAPRAPLCLSALPRAAGRDLIESVEEAHRRSNGERSYRIDWMGTNRTQEEVDGARGPLRRLIANSGIEEGVDVLPGDLGTVRQQRPPVKKGR